MQDLRAVPVSRSLLVGLRILVVVIVLQLRGITRARYPGLLEVEALALTAPLFLVMLTSDYVVLAQEERPTSAPTSSPGPTRCTSP